MSYEIGTTDQRAKVAGIATVEEADRLADQLEKETGIGHYVVAEAGCQKLTEVQDTAADLVAWMVRRAEKDITGSATERVLPQTRALMYGRELDTLLRVLVHPFTTNERDAVIHAAAQRYTELHW